MTQQTPEWKAYWLDDECYIARSPEHAKETYFVWSDCKRHWTGSDPVEANPDAPVFDDLGQPVGTIENYILGVAEDNPEYGEYLFGEN